MAALLAVVAVTILLPAIAASGCNITHLTSPETTHNILSPGYPERYPDNTEECWIVDTLKLIPPHRETYQIHIILMDFKVDQSSDCTRQFLEIRDGDSRKKPLLARYCGSDKNEAVHHLISSKGVVYIHLKSDESGIGFQLGLKAVAEAPEIAMDNERSECKILTIGSRDVTYILSTTREKDHDGENKIPTSECYVINIREGLSYESHYNIYFRIDADVANSFDICKSDYLRVFNGYSGAENMVTKVCADSWVPEITFKSPGNMLLVKIEQGYQQEEVHFHGTFGLEHIQNELKKLRRKRSTLLYSNLDQDTNKNNTSTTDINAAYIGGGVLIFVALVLILLIPLIIYCCQKKKQSHTVVQPVVSASYGSGVSPRIHQNGNQELGRGVPSRWKPTEQGSVSLGQPPPPYTDYPPPAYEDSNNHDLRALPISEPAEMPPPYC